MIRPVVLCALFLALCISPASTAAQQGEHMGHGAGTPANEATAASAIAFITTFVELMNAQDPTAVNLTTEQGWEWFFRTPDYFEAQAKVQNGELSPITIHEIGNVLVHPDGAVSVEVLYSGYGVFYTNIFTERWYMLPDGVGGYVLDNADWYVPVRVPEGMTSAEVTLSIGAEGVQVEPREVPGAPALSIEVVNLQQDAWSTTGIYVLPPGVMPMDAQAQILAVWGTGQPFPFETITITPRPPGETRASVIQVEPGTTLLIQQWTLDETGQNPQPIQGEQHVTTITISAEPAATPSS